MKLNGALKPRQGASKQGSSPGVVLKEYRVKRYFKVNKNVVKGVPLNACGVKNKKSFNDENIIYSCNYICNNNQQQKQKQQTTTLLELKGKCGETFSRSINNSSLSRLNFSTSIKIKDPINFKTQNTKRSRVSALTVTSIRKETSVQVDSKQGTDTNIPTRQVRNRKLKKESVKNKDKNNNIRSDESIMKQVGKNKSHHNTTNIKEVNKFFFVPKINVIPNFRAIILRFFIQLKLLLFSMFSHAIKRLNGKPFAHSAGGGEGSTRLSSITLLEVWCLHCCLVGYNLAKMMRACSFESICLKNARGSRPSVALYLVIYAATAILLPHAVIGDDGDTFFPINGIETTTPEFDYASRGQKKFGDKCENTLECGFPGSICDAKKKSCQCTEDLPVTNHIDKCGKEAAVNESCFFNEQCEVKYFQTECRDQRCVCRFDMTPVWLKDGSVECKGRGDKKGPETYVDPAMIGVLIGMALMFIIICVVLRLFSQARWRENRTIFNTPNPRLMNVSLLRESKLLHGQERRGSRMSVRAPSRQPSMASLRPHSPNPSLGKTGSRSNSHGSSASATSLKSTRSNCVSPAGVANNSHHERKSSTYQPHQHHHPQQQKLQPLQQEEEQTLTQTNIISNPVAETVTVEIIEPEKFTKANE